MFENALNDSFALWHISDINECLPNGGLGPCAQICINTIGSFYCGCQPGYNLSGYVCNGMHDRLKLNLYMYFFVILNEGCMHCNNACFYY